MPNIVFMEFYRAIDVLSSEESLRAIEVELSPHLKKEKRKELISLHQQRIKSGVDRTGGRLATVQDLAKAFARMKMNGG